MKVMAFSARPDEAVFYDYYEKALGLELTRCKDGLSPENVGQTRGMDGVSCVGTCDLYLTGPTNIVAKGEVTDEDLSLAR